MIKVDSFGLKNIAVESKRLYSPRVAEVLRSNKPQAAVAWYRWAGRGPSAAKALHAFSVHGVLDVHHAWPTVGKNMSHPAQQKSTIYIYIMSVKQ